MFDRFARAVSRAAGSKWAFGLAVLSVAVWAALGPRYGYSDAWSLSVNTGTTIVTFWMGFLILNTATRNDAGIHLKLDELIRVTKEARNELIGAEEWAEEEIAALKAK